MADDAPCAKLGVHRRTKLLRGGVGSGRKLLLCLLKKVELLAVLVNHNVAGRIRGLDPCFEWRQDILPKDAQLRGRVELGLPGRWRRRSTAETQAFTAGEAASSSATRAVQYSLLRRA